MDQMDTVITRRKRIDYFALNDGSDEEAPPEDRLNSSRPYSSADSLPDSEIFPSESASAIESSLEIQDDALTCQPRHIELRSLNPRAGSVGTTLIYL
ncbi:hypothetical protein V1522DRAFT_415593, partial [Lipomyces starkeyi]